MKAELHRVSHQYCFCCGKLFGGKMLVLVLPWLFVALFSATTTTVAAVSTTQKCNTSADCITHPAGTITCFLGECYICNDVESNSVPYPSSGDTCTKACSGEGAYGDAECAALLNQPTAICASPMLSTWSAVASNGYNAYNGVPTYKDISGAVKLIQGFCAPCPDLTLATCSAVSPPPVEAPALAPAPAAIISAPPPTASNESLSPPPPSGIPPPPTVTQKCTDFTSCDFGVNDNATASCYKGSCAFCDGQDSFSWSFPTKGATISDVTCVLGCARPFSSKSDKSCNRLSNGVQPFCSPFPSSWSTTAIKTTDVGGKVYTFGGYCTACDGQYEAYCKEKKPKLRLTWMLFGIGAAMVILPSFIILLCCFCISRRTVEDTEPKYTSNGSNEGAIQPRVPYTDTTTPITYV